MTATMAHLRTTLTIQMAMDRQLIAARVIELRERNRLTQEGLRDKSGLSLRTIQRVEKPDPKKLTELRHSTVDALAKALGVEPREITDGTAVVTADPPARTPDLLGQFNGEPTQLDRVEQMLRAVLTHLEEAAFADAASEEEKRAGAPRRRARRPRPAA